MGIVRRSRQLVRTLHFQNPYGIDGRTPDHHKIQMCLDGYALMLPVDLKLGQYMQAQGCQSLANPGFKPMPALQGQQALQAVCGGQHLSGQRSPWTFPVLTNVTHVQHRTTAAPQCGKPQQPRPAGRQNRRTPAPTGGTRRGCTGVNGEAGRPPSQSGLVLRPQIMYFRPGTAAGRHAAGGAKRLFEYM